VAASFPVGHEDGVMLVTDAGKLIRTSVTDVRIVGRKTQGVMLLRTAESESVVSVARLADLGGNGENGEESGEGDAAPSGDPAEE
jgi:DNA gyrase subunit A